MNAVTTNQRQTLARIAVVLILTPLLALNGCMSLDSMDQFTAEWDQQHAPGTGITGSRLGQVVTILATYEATLEQRRIAEQRARQAQARIVRQQQAARQQQAKARQKAQSKPRTSIASNSSSNSSSKPTASRPAPTEPEVTVPGMPRRIAVDVPDERKKGATTVMLWDTASEQLVGNEVYDLSDRPAKGNDLALWSGANAQYVGKP